MKKIIIFIFFIFASAGISNSATYYVNATGGSDSYNGLYSTYQSGSNGPWLTLSKASSTPVAGDTIYFMSGTYNGSLNPSNSGSAGNWITWKVYPGETAYIVATSGAGGGNAVNLRTYGPVAGWTQSNYKGYWEVNGFDITSAYNNGITFYNVHHIRILNNYVHDTTHSGITGVSVQDHTLIEGNRVDRNSWGSAPCGSGISIWNSGCLFPTVSGEACNVINDGAAGYHVIVQKNIIHGNNNDGSSCYGTNGTDGNGIIMDNNGTSNLPTLIANNLIYNNGARGVQILNSSNVHVINNTLKSNNISVGNPATNGSGELQVASLSYDLALTNIEFKNNLVYGNGYQGCLRQRWTGGSGSISSTVSDNLLYYPSPTYVTSGCTGWTGYDCYRNSGGTYSACNWSGTDEIEESDPLFLATPTCTGTPAYECDWESVDFRINGNSPAYNTGITTDLTTDFIGVTRTVNYDIGAYEYIVTGTSIPGGFSAPGGVSIR